MDSNTSPRTQITDLLSGSNRFRAEVLSGLKKPQKELPPKYFYDERGSQLFERITTLDEYYPTRIELAIMEKYADEMTALLGPNVLVIEYGSGSSTKTRILLNHLERPAAYMPIDISREQLQLAAQALETDYPELEVIPICADYSGVFQLPEVQKPVSRRVVYFPGSTIGNFEPRPAQQFLERVAGVCGPNGLLIIGIDLKKDPVVLHHAYNDREGVTADFNLNLLTRINRELGANFKLERFKHYAFYNPPEGRVEMHLVSTQEQVVELADLSIPFQNGESIWTESSYKYNLDEFSELAASAGFKTEQAWFDEQRWFAVVCCSVH